MIEPVSDALTTSIRPAWSAKNAMISSAMLPNVALRMPPTCGPVSDAEPLGRQADDPGQPEDRRPPTTTNSERLVGVEAEVEDDRDDADERPCRAGHDPRRRRERAEDGQAAGRAGGQRRHRRRSYAGRDQSGSPVERAARHAGRGGDASRRVAPGHARRDEPLDLGAGSVHRAPAPSASAASAAPRRATHPTTSDELAARRDRAVRGRLGELAERARGRSARGAS